MKNLSGKNILLIISGGIAAYKSVELISILGRKDVNVQCIITDGGKKFVTPVTVSALCGQKVCDDIWELRSEKQISHTQIARECDLVVIAPASANMIARASMGMASDLASAVLLATDKPVMFAPTMNPNMWANPAVQENVRRLEERGYIRVGPNSGNVACGDTGTGRMAEPEEIAADIENFLEAGLPLSGRKAVVTSGPTYEAIDPVRFIGNRSSGKQGHAIARSLKQLGAEVTLVSGPVALPDPAGVKVVKIESAREMHEAVMNALPADIAVCAAAVADWRPENTNKDKIKKNESAEAPLISLTENPDVLASVSSSDNRPEIVVGFAAETENLIEAGQKKLVKKGCDWIIANNVGKNGEIFGNDSNHVHLITHTGTEEWPDNLKNSIAEKLAKKIAEHLSGHGN